VNAAGSLDGGTVVGKNAIFEEDEITSVLLVFLSVSPVKIKILILKRRIYFHSSFAGLQKMAR